MAENNSYFRCGAARDDEEVGKEKEKGVDLLRLIYEGARGRFQILIVGSFQRDAASQRGHNAYNLKEK